VLHFQIYQQQMLTIKKPINYLNNRDILKEIHLSKNTYCVYDQADYHQYDIIIDYLDNKNIEDNIEYASRPETIQRAREQRAARLNAEDGRTEKVAPEDIPVNDLIFRIMTWDHIPIAPKQPRKVVKKKSAKEIFDFDEEELDDLFSDLEDVTPSVEINDLVHVRLNFPPFQHFKFDGNNLFRCVGKSHWNGDLVHGEFSKDHGQITNKLAKMYLMLCEKYALRFNWRGYTYVDEMRASAVLQLTYVGLRFNESKSENPFAYYTQAINNSFCRVLNTEKRNQNIRDDILELNGLNPSWSRQFAGSGIKSSDE
jgi:hypothetical protein